jgi:hypothetical protein
MANPFAGLQQGMQAAGSLLDMYNAPKMQALALEQEQAKLAQMQGLDPVSQSQIKSREAQTQLAQRQQSRLDEATKMEMGQIVAQMATGAKAYLDAGDEEGANRYFAAVEQIIGKPVPPEARTKEFIDGIISSTKNMGSSIDRSKLALNIEKLKFERQKETNDQRKEQLDRDIRAQELELKRQSEQRQSKKLSAASEKNLIQSQDAYGQFIEDSRQFKLLSDDYERLDPQGGVFASIDEFFAKVLGSQDEVNELRRRFNKIRISEGLKNLPPGPATDKDVELALKGVPAEGASKEQVMSFLRGASRMATISAAYNQFKSEYISDKGNTRGLIGSWREEVSLPRDMASRMGRETVSMAEIYETAIEEGVTKAEVMRRLGIE